MTLPLSKTFFQKDAFTVAKRLLGSYLVRKYRGKIKRYMITEIEVYDGFDDKASHAFKGKTPRNTVMFGPGGYWYVYYIYGIHHMLNIVVDKKDYPAAILIRSIVSEDGSVINGPGKLTRELHIDKALHTKSADQASGLWIERGVTVKKKKIEQTPRIGVAYAGPVWSQKPYRFILHL